MYALTILQPWAWAIIHAGKVIENRTWPLPAQIIGQRIAIHAAKRSMPAEFATMAKYLRLAHSPLDVPNPDDLVFGAIIGTVEVTECVARSDSSWFIGQHGFILRNPRMLTTPIICTGRQLFWHVPNKMARRIHAQ